MRSPKSLLRMIFLVPFGAVTIILIALGIVFYRVGTDYVIRDVYSPHLLHALSEKKHAIDGLLGTQKRDLELLSANAAIRENALALKRARDKVDASQKKSAVAAQQNIARFLDLKLFSENYAVVAILSAEGQVIASTEKGQEGEDWSERDFFRQMASKLKDSTLLDFRYHGDSNYRMLFLVPIVDAEKNVIAMVYSLSHLDRLTESLRQQGDPYKTERVSVIDREGNVVITADGVPARKTKYDPSITSHENVVEYRTGTLYSSTSLSHAPFRLLGTAEKSEVLRVPAMLFILYCSIAAVIILLMSVQALYLVPRFYTRPLVRLAATAHAVARGNLDVDLGGGYRGESDKLKKGVEALVEALRGKEFLLGEKAASLEKTLQTSVLLQRMAYELGISLKVIVNDLNMTLQREGGFSATSRKTLSRLLSISEEKDRAMDDLHDLLDLEKGTSPLSVSEFSLWDLIREVETASGKLIGSKEVDLLSDCDRAFLNVPVHTDRDRLRRAVANLLSNAAGETETGMITLLTTRTEVEGQDHIEISVASQGEGIDPEVLARPFEELDYPYYPLGLFISKRLARALRGRLEVESMPGKGSVFTITVPSRIPLNN